MTYTKEELLDELRDAHEQAKREKKKVYYLLNDRFNDYPTVATYNKYFDTLDEAYEAAGLDRGKWEQSKRCTGHDFDIASALDRCDGYDVDADGYVYVLRFEEQMTGFEYLYVGSTMSELNLRLNQHRSKCGSASMVKRIDGVPVKVGVTRHDSHIQEIVEVQSINAENLHIDESFIGGVIDAREKYRHNELVREHGPESVLGGN